MHIRITKWIVLAALTAASGASLAADSDGDGVDDSIDNCRGYSNPLQFDADADGFGNRCDVDFNQNGLADGRDVKYFTKAIKSQDPVADINEDGKVDASDPIAAIPLWGRPPGPGADPADDDGDGVPLIADRCPDGIGTGTPGYEGCSRADLALQAPRLITAPVARMFRSVFSEFEAIPPEFEGIAALTEEFTRSFEWAGVLAARGESCAGAELAQSTVDRLDRLRDELAQEIFVQRGIVGRDTDPPGGTPGEDWDDAHDFVNAMAQYWQAEQQYDEGFATAVSAAADMQGLCDAETGPELEEGTVSYYDPNARVLEFEFGAVVAVAEEFQQDPDPSGDEVPLGAGVQIQAQGVGFSDGSVMVKRITPLEDRFAEPFEDRTCVDLRIAPYQLSPKYTGQAKEVHDARSYIRTGFSTLSLEPGMDLGIATEGCPEPDGAPAVFSVYGARIRLTADAGTVRLADFLEPPYLVELPEWIGAFETIEITVTTRRKDCQTLNPTDCTATRDVGIEFWEGVMRPRGYYCAVDYAQTEFALEDVAPGTFAVTWPSFLTVFEGPGRDNPTSHFVGLGWRVRDGVPGAQVEEVRMLEDFAIFERDFRDNWEDLPNFVASEEATNFSLLGLANDPLEGVVERPGLVWPSLRGTHNGGPFRFSCRTPRVSRDVVGFCSGHGNAFFEWPDIFGQVTQGPNGTFTHTNDEAWDIGMSTGTSVYAARPGTVVFKEETKTDTCDPPADDQEDPKCDGNGVRIRHSDGSTASYWHLETGEVLVNKYDLVDRGQRIALSGNTGYSTGPHLHLESSRNQAAENAWFHAWKGFELDEVNCYEPQKGDLIGNLFLD
jgi:hypothetical protein